MLISERFLRQFCQHETTWCMCIVFQNLSFSEETKIALDTTLGHTSQQCMTQLWNQQQMATRVPFHHHTDDEFCTNCSSCGGHGVTDDSLTEQPQCWPIWEPTCGELPIRAKRVYSSNWVWALSVPMHLGLKTTPLCPILWCQVMGALVLHRRSRLPPDSGSKHNPNPQKKRGGGAKLI
jgi:hypothetical protein